MNNLWQNIKEAIDVCFCIIILLPLILVITMITEKPWEYEN